MKTQSTQTKKETQKENIPGQKLVEAVLKCYILGGFLIEETDFLKSISFYALQHMKVRELWEINKITKQMNPKDDASMDDYVNTYLHVLDGVFEREDNLGETAANVLSGVVHPAPDADTMPGTELYRIFSQVLQKIK